MVDYIECIDAIIYKNEDGSYDCPWLVPYYGDMTDEVYEAAGTALSVRRGCEYCYKMLEWKTRLKEEEWNKKDVAHASHPDWPGEWVTVNEITDKSGLLIGYEVQWKLYKLLHEVESEGWELIYSYYSKGKEIYKLEEVKIMPKQKYWTKCGRVFEKNRTATVTGYEIDLCEDGTISEAYQILKKEAREALAKCVDCPFRISVKEGWPLVHKKWECRAGSRPPNYETTWRGSLDDKCTIQIDSLDHKLMEEIRQYCEDHTDLSASYNADHMADCRRTLSISCSQNKRGIAAKKELIEMFFPEQNPVFCRDCVHRIKSDKGEGHPFPWMCYEASGREGFDFYLGEDCPGCSNFKSSFKADQNESFNDSNGLYCFGDKNQDEYFARDLISAVKEFNCENENVMAAYKKCAQEDEVQSLVSLTQTADIVDDREVKLNNYISDIKDKSQNIVLDYIKIGLTLIRINNEKLYEIKGYSNLIEFAQGELNFSKTLLYNTMALAQKFGLNTKKEEYVIDQKYKDFSLSQLTEMISITDDRLPGVTQDMTVKEIRKYKQEVKKEEFQNNDPKLKEIDKYFTDKGFFIGKSAFSISYGKKLEYTGEYYKDDYGIDFKIDDKLEKGDFDVVWLAKFGGREHKLPFGFVLSFEGGFEGCIRCYESMVKNIAETGNVQKIIMLYDTFIINGYEPVSDFAPELDSENNNTQIELLQWNSTFEKDSYNIEITAELVKGNFRIQIYDDEMTINKCFEVNNIEEIFPTLIEYWSKLLTIEILKDSLEKIKYHIKGVTYYKIDFVLETQEFVIKTSRMRYEIEIRTDVEMTLASVKYSKFGDSTYMQSRMNFDEVTGFIEGLAEVKQVAAVVNGNESITTITVPEIIIKVPDNVKANEGDDEIVVTVDKDVKAINFILSKMNYLIRLHNENKTVKFEDKERDPMAAYYILKEFLIEYYEISANMK